MHPVRDEVRFAVRDARVVHDAQALDREDAGA